MERTVDTALPDSIYRSGEYLRNNPSWHAEDAGWKLGHVIDLIRRNGLEPDNIVEVGTGAGEVLKLLADEVPAARLSGFDISPDAIRIASPKATGRLSYHLGSPFGQSGYDLALALDVFEHIETIWASCGRWRASRPTRSTTFRWICRSAICFKRR